MKQITILTVNKSDAIAEVTSCLADAGIDIESITGDSYGAQTVITLTVKDYDAALAALHSHDELTILREDALLVRVEDEVGALAKLSRTLTEHGVHIRSIRFVERQEGFALVAISVEQQDLALAHLMDILVGE